MVKIPSRACQAKDPATCLYHGTENVEKHRFLATNHYTPGVVLGELAKDKDDDVRWGVARNSNSLIVTLVELARDKDYNVRRGVAVNPNTPVVTLTGLAKDELVGVRWAVATNPNTPTIVLTKLAKDELVGVRRRVARNPNTSAMILAELAKDEDQQVVELAITNLRRLPKKELLTLFSNKERKSLKTLPKAWVLKLLLL